MLRALYQPFLEQINRIQNHFSARRAWRSDALLVPAIEGPSRSLDLFGEVTALNITIEHT